MKFGKKAGQTSNQQGDDSKPTAKPYVRDTSDNKLFKDIQIDHISDYIHDGTVFYYDYDTPIYKIASNLENKVLKVTHKDDPTITDQVKNITTFRGRSKKTVTENSWLGMKNVDRELQGLEPWTQDDFIIEEMQILKYDTEEAALEQAKIELRKGLKKVREQFLIKNIIPVIGSGDNFRNKLPTCRPYKGNRSETLRPLLLKTLREWAVTDLGAIDVQPRPDGEMIEADDFVEFYGYLGILSFRKTGKFDYGVIASDKDALNSAKLLINADLHVGEHNPLRGKFKFPQPMLIKATDKCAGDLELVVKGSKTTTKEVKGYGFKFLMYQALLGQDQADNYNALSHLGQGLDFGDLSAYKVLKPCKTAKECLQACIDTYAELLPKGVQYTTHDGIEMDVDTMSYMNTYFRVAYMTRSDTDDMDFYKLCKAFNVDTSKVEGNNVEKVLPLRPEVEIREVLKGFDSVLEAIQEDLMNQKGRKDDLMERMTSAATKLGYLQHDLVNGLFENG